MTIKTFESWVFGSQAVPSQFFLSHELLEGQSSNQATRDDLISWFSTMVQPGLPVNSRPGYFNNPALISPAAAYLQGFKIVECLNKNKPLPVHVAEPLWAPHQTTVAFLQRIYGRVSGLQSQRKPFLVRWVETNPGRMVEVHFSRVEDMWQLDQIGPCLGKITWTELWRAEPQQFKL